MQDLSTCLLPPDGARPRARQHAAPTRPNANVPQRADAAQAQAQAPRSVHSRFIAALKYLLPWN